MCRGETEREGEGESRPTQIAPMIQPCICLTLCINQHTAISWQEMGAITLCNGGTMYSEFTANKDQSGPAVLLYTPGYSN